MTYGEWLKSERKRLGITQIDLANYSEVSVNTIRNYEQGKGEPRKAIQKKIKHGLQILDDLTDSGRFTIIDDDEVRSFIEQEEYKPIDEFNTEKKLINNLLNIAFTRINTDGVLAIVKAISDIASDPKYLKSDVDPDPLDQDDESQDE